MRFGEGPESDNLIDRTGGGHGGLNLGGGLGMILPLIASRFGITGILILLLGYCVLTQFGGGGFLSGGGGGTGQSTLPPEQRRFLGQVLGSTEQVWGQIFQQAGAQYRPTPMVLYTNHDQSGCGMAQAAMGPFYCPTDQRVYIDPDFFEELSRRFGAPGDFAQAYVIAHEVGHHIQNLEGTLDRAQAAQARLGEAEGNQVQVGVELQADCYAGVWAKRSGALEQGDIEEGMRAAEAIGDDTLQKQT
ncbi:MAG TPA: neutral zinc metallopeptidase, partial [Sphingomicrobium sp.]|nr:neutral zinc metallopeptidase [Sphingomicrobium sp.]